MKINIKNEDKINSAIKAAEGPLVLVCQADCASVYKSVKQIETRLSGLLPKKDWPGLVFWCDPNARTFPKAYNGAPLSTQYKIERGSNSWFLTSVYRRECDTKAIRARNIESKSKEMSEHIAENF